MAGIAGGTATSNGSGPDLDLGAFTCYPNEVECSERHFIGTRACYSRGGAGFQEVGTTLGSSTSSGLCVDGSPGRRSEEATARSRNDLAPTVPCEAGYLASDPRFQMIRIPFGDRRQRNALAHVVEGAAEAAGIGPYQLAVIMTHFFEQLALAVAAGETVTIPGFGQFVPVAWQPHDATQPKVALPRFLAATGFKQEVRQHCPITKAQNLDVSAYLRRHATRIARSMTRARTSSAMDAMRHRLMAQARRNYAEVVLQKTV